MSCQTYSNQVKDLLENKLDEQSAEQVTLHLISCPSCEAEFENHFYRDELYTDFLFGVEPPNNLPAKFQAKLEAEERKTTANESSTGLSERLSKAFAFLRLSKSLPMVCALVLSALCFGISYFLEVKEVASNDHFSSITSEIPQKIVPKPDIFETGNENSVFASPSVKAARTGRIEVPNLKKEFVKLSAINKKPGKRAAAKPETAPKNPELSAEKQNQIAQVQSLETDAARQIEKVEILFRAFRNARSTEENGRYNVDYEKQQARRLLRNNVWLKQRAENYGTLLTEETLNKIEPYLLDIANLDGNPPAEKVSEIKERFRNRNIIADLQGL